MSFWRSVGGFLYKSAKVLTGVFFTLFVLLIFFGWATGCHGVAIYVACS